MHYGEPVPQHHVETSHSYDNLGQHPNYVPQSANVHENSHMHYHQPHVNSMNPYGHQVMENNVMHPSHYNMVPGQNHGKFSQFIKKEKMNLRVIALILILKECTKKSQWKTHTVL